MTTEQRNAINQQNAQLSTGPKTEEGKAKSAQNAVTHGLSSQKQPLENPRFRDLLKGFQKDYAYPQSPTAQTWVQELAHIAWKLEQIPSIEQQIEQDSGLTLAEHFMQDKPTPLVKLWNLQLRLGGRFNSLVRKLQSPCHCSVSSGNGIPANDVPILQNKPNLGAPSSSSGPLPLPPPPQKPILQNKPLCLRACQEALLKK